MSNAIEKAGARLLFLPPDSPDFNAIENAFSKLMALLRAKAERTINALWDAVRPLLDQSTPAECANYFEAAEYDPGIDRTCSSVSEAAARSNLCHTGGFQRAFTFAEIRSAPRRSKGSAGTVSTAREGIAGSLST